MVKLLAWLAAELPRRACVATPPSVNGSWEAVVLRNGGEQAAWRGWMPSAVKGLLGLDYSDGRRRASIRAIICREEHASGAALRK